MLKFLHRVYCTIKGFTYAFLHDQSFRGQCISMALIFGVAWYFLHPLQPWEWLFFGLAYALILITELQNSALEEALDKLHPEHHINIGRSKDMASAAVMVAGVFVAGVLTVVVIFRLYS